MVHELAPFEPESLTGGTCNNWKKLGGQLHSPRQAECRGGGVQASVLNATEIYLDLHSGYLSRQ
jgi:hypothetical protein